MILRTRNKRDKIMHNPTTDPHDLELELKHLMPQLEKTLIDSKLQQQEVLALSAAQGGPDNPHTALLNVVNACKLGVRRLASHVGVSRLKMKSMLEGKSDIPADVLNKIITLCESLRPDLFED